MTRMRLYALLFRNFKWRSAAPISRRPSLRGRARIPPVRLRLLFGVPFLFMRRALDSPLAGLLSERELTQFWEDGFVVKHNVFRPAELKPCMQAIEKVCLAYPANIKKCFYTSF
jgi:hypothetical protein